MDGKYNEVELLFIRYVLDRHGEYPADLLQDEVIRKRLRISDELLERMNYRVSEAINFQFTTKFITCIIFQFTMNPALRMSLCYGLVFFHSDL
nr:hypothetical protein [Bacteroidota bacterium]